MKKSYFFFYFQKPYRIFEWKNFQKSDIESMFMFCKTDDQPSVIFFEKQIKKNNFEINSKKFFRSHCFSSIFFDFLNELFLEKFESFSKLFSRILSYTMVKFYENSLFLFIPEKLFSAVHPKNFFLRTNMDLDILTYFKTLNEMVFFQNFQKLSQKKKKQPFFHFLNLSLYKFKINNFFSNWMQISIFQLQKFFLLVLQTSQNFVFHSSQKEKRKMSRKNTLLTCQENKEFEIFLNTNYDTLNKYKPTQFLLFEKTAAQKNLFNTKIDFFKQQILYICFQFFFEIYQYFYVSKNLKNSKNKNRMCENFLFKIQPSSNFINTKKQYEIFTMNYWFFQFLFVWDFFSWNSNFSTYVFLPQNMGKNLFSYSPLNRKRISSKICNKFFFFQNKNPILQNQFSNNKKNLIFMMSQQFLKNSKKIINRILFFQFSKNPDPAFLEQNFPIAPNRSFLRGDSSIKKNDFENIFQNMNKSLNLSFELNFSQRKCIFKDSCFDKIFNLFVLNFQNIVSDRFYETRMCVNSPKVHNFCFWNKIYISHETMNEQKFFQNWNPMNQCYVSQNIFWFVGNFEIFQNLNVFDFSNASFFQEKFSICSSKTSKPLTSSQPKLPVFPQVCPLFFSKQSLLFDQKKQKKNSEEKKNQQNILKNILKNILFSLQFIENIYDKILCHFQKFLTFQKIPQISRVKYSSSCFVSVSFFDIFLFPDGFWKNQAKPFILQFVFLYFFQDFLFKDFTFMYLHNSICSYRFLTKFLKHSFLLKNWLFFNIFSKKLSFQRKIFWFEPKNFSLLFFDRHFYFQKFQWLLPNNCIFLSTSIENTNFFAITAFSILQCSFNLFSFFFFELCPIQNVYFSEKNKHFCVNEKTNQFQLFRKFQKILFFLTGHNCSFLFLEKNMNINFNINSLNIQKDMCQNMSAFRVSDFFIILYFKHEKNIQPILFFQKKPTSKAISMHMNECQKILQRSIGQTQLTFMKKLQKKISVWSIHHKSASTQKIFHFCDAIFMKYLWNWAKKTHPNKSKYWIRQKYFHLNSQKKWFFGKKIGNRFICLQFHSQFQFA